MTMRTDVYTFEFHCKLHSPWRLCLVRFTVFIVVAWGYLKTNMSQCLCIFKHVSNFTTKFLISEVNWDISSDQCTISDHSLFRARGRAHTHTDTTKWIEWNKTNDRIAHVWNILLQIGIAIFSFHVCLFICFLNCCCRVCVCRNSSFDWKHGKKGNRCFDICIF